MREDLRDVSLALRSISGAYLPFDAFYGAHCPSHDFTGWMEWVRYEVGETTIKTVFKVALRSTIYRLRQACIFNFTAPPTTPMHYATYHMQYH